MKVSFECIKFRLPMAYCTVKGEQPTSSVNCDTICSSSGDGVIVNK